MELGQCKRTTLQIIEALLKRSYFAPKSVKHSQKLKTQQYFCKQVNKKKDSSSKVQMTFCASIP